MPSLLDARRAAAAFVAVAMSAALIAFAFILSDSFRTQMRAEARLSIGGADVVVASGRQLSSTDGHLDDALVSRLADLDGIASVRGEHWGILQLDLPRQLAGTVGSAIMIRDVPVLSQYTTLAAGRLPIGTGEVATPEDAQEVCGAIRRAVTELYDEATGQSVRIQYGGSVKPGSVTAIMAKPDIDGALVGGASLKPDDFAAIVRFYAMAQA